MTDAMHFMIMPSKGTIDVVFILRRIQEEYLAKQKLHMCFVDLEKAFDRVLRKVVDWAMRKKGSDVNIGVHHGSVLSPLLLAIVIDVATNEIKEGTLQEILNADDLVLIAETVAELDKKIILGKVHLRVKA